MPRGVWKDFRESYRENPVSINRNSDDRYVENVVGGFKLDLGLFWWIDVMGGKGTYVWHRWPLRGMSSFNIARGKI